LRPIAGTECSKCISPTPDFPAKCAKFPRKTRSFCVVGLCATYARSRESITTLAPPTQAEPAVRFLEQPEEAMKIHLSQCLYAGLLILVNLTGVAPTVAQPSMQYRIHWVDIPVNYDNLFLQGINDHRMITGYWSNDSDGLLNGFIYDLSDEANPVYYDLRTFLNLPAVWVETWGKHINNHGQGVAIVEDSTGYRRGIWFDMVTATWDFVPEPVDGTFSNRILNNNHGDIVVGFQKSNDENDFFVYNPDPVTGYAPIHAGIDAWVVRISDSGHVAGELSAIDFEEWLFRWLPVPGNSQPEILAYHTFQNFGVVNGLGEIAGVYRNSANGGPGGTSSFEVFRYRSDTDFDFLPVETFSAKGFNNSGDIAGNLDNGEQQFNAFGGSRYDAFVYHDAYGVTPLDDLVIGVDAQFFRDADIIFGGPQASVLTNRDDTGFGSIIGYARLTTTTGKGRNKVTTTERRSFVLIPELLVPEPGISASPDSGLITSESGAEAIFTVVLDTPPAADVTIALNSSSPTEGVVDPGSLTFTPFNWDVPQSVTVTGVNDDPPLEDGDVPYEISLTPSSSDPEYASLGTLTVGVINLDDDSPAGNDSSTYESTDTPLMIPDNDPVGIASIVTADDHLISRLTVNVNISHPQPSDLVVCLIDPAGGAAVELTNFSGHNTVTEFDGTSSFGVWTLEVFDTVEKKKGKLNSWSITVDY
jgi:hypothetical protein